MRIQNERHPRLDGRSARLAIGRLTQLRYERARRQFSAIQIVESKLYGKIGPMAPYIIRDVFSTMYDKRTVIDEVTEGKPIRKMMDWIWQQMDSVPEWRRMKATMGEDMLSACFATVEIGTCILNLPWDDKCSPDANLTRPNGDKYTIRMNEDSKSITHTKQGYSGPQETTARFKTTEEAAEAYKKSIINAKRGGWKMASPGDPASMEKAMVKSIEKMMTDETAIEYVSESAANNVHTIGRCMKYSHAGASLGYGIMKADEEMKSPSDEYLKFASRIIESESVRSFIDKVGRLLQSMKDAVPKEYVRGTVSPYDINTTSNLSRLLPMEMAMLGVPGMQSVQMAKIVGGKSLGWQNREIGVKSKGPFHIALDKSGSMMEGMETAKAFAAAALIYASDNMRQVSISVFDYHNKLIDVDMLKPESRMSSLLDISKITASGGTSFNPVVEHVSTLPHNADLLLISDGDGPLTTELADEVFASRELHYIVIGKEADANKDLKRLSGNNMVVVSSITDEGSITLAAKAAAV